jgi:hypothetical protein
MRSSSKGVQDAAARHGKARLQVILKPHQSTTTAELKWRSGHQQLEFRQAKPRQDNCRHPDNSNAEAYSEVEFDSPPSPPRTQRGLASSGNSFNLVDSIPIVATIT